MSLRFRTLRGAELAEAIPALAALRIAVFRDWPYLYDGDVVYEAHYLECYRDCPQSVVILAETAEGEVVGAATGMPARDHADVSEAYDALAKPGMEIFYCAESVLHPAYRGQGAGHRFFDAREAHARALGATHASFCAVTRPVDHPARPAEARDLHPFWRKRGYAPVDGAELRMRWLDVGASEETEKPLQIWMRAL
ncbi:GNAT family N-acetyltransferase [Dinoroseobacter sp. S375]|uniref:GNAT family N-acetyltransferase n=1 Tax=Dinoroseobacter sp. S375 TaxID=3415136 RepID=UPI003C7A620E